MSKLYLIRYEGTHKTLKCVELILRLIELYILGRDKIHLHWHKHLSTGNYLR